MLGDAAFHCQQAVEKALKAFLTWHDRPFRRTHDLAELGGLCVSIAPMIEPLLRSAAPLTEYAWRYRYPGDPFVPPIDEVRDALAVARNVVATVVDQLPTEARP